MSQPLTKNYPARPLGMKDGQGNVNPNSYNDAAFQGDNGGGVNLVYMGRAKPGTSTSAAAWQIRKLTYDANGNVLTITWPTDSYGRVSNDFEFVWTSRTSYVYS
jgi:YD repeat-containing protein